MKENEAGRLPYADFETLLIHPPGQGATYFIRHAERAPLAGPETIVFADLTEKGWADARRFGQRLGEVYKISSVLCSPVDRCIHTGTAILEGAGVSLRPQTRWWLFSPFLRAQDNQPSISINSTTVPESGVGCLDKKSLHTVLERIKIPPHLRQINLYITHDSTVTPLLGMLMGLDTVWVNQYPQYLEGFVLVRDGAGNPTLFKP